MPLPAPPSPELSPPAGQPVSPTPPSPPTYASPPSTTPPSTGLPPPTAEPPSPIRSSPQFPQVLILQPPPPPSPPKPSQTPSLPPSPPTSPPILTAPPSPLASSVPPSPPAPPLPPSAIPVAATRLDVEDMPAFGAKGRTRRLVWANDPDFKIQNRANSPLQLVDRNKTACPSACRGCRFAWKATNNSRSVAVFFKDPFLLSRISIVQTRNTGVIRVQTIKWTYPPQGLSTEKFIGRTIYDVPSDPTKCKATLNITNVTDAEAGLDLPVPADPIYNQANLPADLQDKVVGGVVITVFRYPLTGTAPRPNSGKNYGPFIEHLTFKGAVVYPQDTSIYQAYVASNTTSS
ncbi:hypothetical protein HYH03_017399 [Edaphochlamys debaryana]|uniref:Uncharacterized protein n=1 Tax=Edaphochlamys debaryana TaxID=47281 RepID=A0A836BQG4_9CHLO|nr:hypothetical protein HYH03_017399 [Edaphochlamys debaryana]|eukprot:KAG2483744.1 hypothetical protein HYH03_017399 [Edaphochlamys debaryana]